MTASEQTLLLIGMGVGIYGVVVVGLGALMRARRGHLGSRAGRKISWCVGVGFLSSAIFLSLVTNVGLVVLCIWALCGSLLALAIWISIQDWRQGLARWPWRVGSRRRTNRNAAVLESELKSGDHGGHDGDS